MRNIWVWGFGVAYIRESTVVLVEGGEVEQGQALHEMSKLTCSLRNKCRTTDPDQQNLAQSGKLSFFIIYKFWQNCALVWQISDHILNIELTHWGLKMPYGIGDLGQHCFYDNVLRWVPQDLTDDKSTLVQQLLVAIRRWRSGSTLVQVMACCLTAPSHYLNQCWLIISKVLWHSSEDIIIVLLIHVCFDRK